jgi:hypothetical protein
VKGIIIRSLKYGGRDMDRYTTRSINIFLRRFGLAALAAVIAVAVFSFPAFAQNSERKKFKSPEIAFSALIEATRNNDTKELLAIFGPLGKDIISSGDAVADKEARERFVKAAGDAVRFSKAGDSKMLAVIGKDGWSFPVPLVKSPQGWSFFTEDGKEEIINRRIGRNELRAIHVALAYVDGQFEYASRDRDGEGTHYAAKFVSSPGKKDGLYWEAAPGEEASPLGPLFARATEEGYTIQKKGEKPSPYQGYYFRILKGQGSNATGSAFDYVINGKMSGGFGMAAYPAEYGVSGIMTLIVNQQGIVYEKDLGPKTEEIAKTMTKYDPDKTWKQEEWTPDALAKAVENTR